MKVADHGLWWTSGLSHLHLFLSLVSSCSSFSLQSVDTSSTRRISVQFPAQKTHFPLSSLIALWKETYHPCQKNTIHTHMLSKSIFIHHTWITMELLLHISMKMAVSLPWSLEITMTWTLSSQCLNFPLGVQFELHLWYSENSWQHWLCVARYPTEYRVSFIFLDYFRFLSGSAQPTLQMMFYKTFTKAFIWQRRRKVQEWVRTSEKGWRVGDDPEKSFLILYLLLCELAYREDVLTH